MERKLKILTSLIGVDLVILTAVLAARGIKNSSYLKGTDADANYHIVLNKNNRIEEDVTSSTYVKNTDLGNPVSFLYTNCSQNNNYHAIINAGGSIKNTSQISGIEKITPVFSGGELIFRASFDGENWGDYATLKSGYDFSFLSGSLPNYIELVPSESDISLQSIDFAYNCVPAKTEAFEKVTSSLTNYDGKYLIVDETSSKALKTVNGSDNTFDVTISNNQILRTTTTDEHTITFNEISSGKYTLVSPSNQYLDYYTSNVQLWWSSRYSSSITFNNNLFSISSSSHYLLFESDHFTYTRTNTTSGRLVSLYKANFEGGAAVPKYLCGLDLNDSKATKYRIGDTFSEFVGGKGLNVSLVYSNGEKVALTTDQFTYVIKNGDTTISSTTPFENVGDYKVYVSYGTVLTKSYDIKVSIVNNPTLVTSIDDLEDDGKYILACNTQGAVSGDISGTNTYLDSVDATFSEDKSEITDYNDEKTVIFTLNESGANWTLSNDDGKQLYATAVKKVAWSTPSTTTYCWSISISSTGTATIGFVNITSYGNINYNSDSPRFTTYSTAQKSVQLYKVSSTVDPTKVQSVSVSGENTVQAGSTITLSATVLPDTATNKNVNWTSSNINVATVNSSGVVTGLVAGTTTITATSAANSKKFGSLAITVTPDPSKVTSVTISPSSTSVEATKQVQLSASVLPTTATDKVVTWESSNTAIATVNSSGLVTGVAAGTATIKAKSHQDSTIYGSCSLTVTPDSSIVTSVTVSPSTATIAVGNTKQLSASVLPTTASDTTVTWSSSDSSIATVSSVGLVTAVKEGSATITAKSNQNNSISGSCAITVTTASQGTITINASDLPTSYGSSNTIQVKDSLEESHKFNASNVANFGSGIQFKASSGYISNTEELTIQSIQLVTQSGKSFSGTLYWGSSANPSSNGVSVSNGNTYENSSNYSYFKLIKNGSNAGYLSKVVITLGTAQPVYPTAISIPSTLDVGVSKSSSLAVTYSPLNCNQGKGINWSSNKTLVATVDSNGLVTGVSTGTATITATSTYNSSFTSSCTVTVTETAADKWTILMYVCGADLESNSSLATGDFTEITSVAGQPDDVNIVIQTGGAKSWNSKYGISSSYNQRYHVENKTLVCDNSKVYSSYTSMGLSSTLKDFIVWGCQTYPADKIGLILWNHGGGMRGVCYDEKKDDDSLLNSEVKSAVSSAYSTLNRTSKFEFIGYDACLMQVQDIAEFNSNYFNYMVASEESESGYGWDYDTWIDDVYSNKSTTVILQAICDGFITENGGTSSSSNDQTLSYLDLSKMADYKTAWENFASALNSKLGSTSASTFASWVLSNVKYYSDPDYNYFHLWDAKDFVNKVSANSTYNPGSTYTNAVLTAHSNLVAYSTCGKGAGKSYGLCCVYVYTQDTQYTAIDSYYTTSHTNFTNWRTFNRNYGDLN